MQTKMQIGKTLVSIKRFNDELNIAFLQEHIFPIIENIEINEHSGHPIVGLLQQDSGFTYMLIYGKKVRNLFRRSGLKNEVPESGNFMAFPNFFPTNKQANDFSQNGKTKQGFPIKSKSIIYNHKGQLRMAVIMYAPEMEERSLEIINFLLNNVLK